MRSILKDNICAHDYVCKDFVKEDALFISPGQE